MRDSSRRAPIRDLTQCGMCGDQMPAARAGLDECATCERDRFSASEHLGYNPNADRWETGGDEVELADESEYAD